MKEKTLLKYLKQIKTILDKHNIEYWLDEGTLLGAVREKKFIEWDHDIDLSVWYSDLEEVKAVFSEIEKLGIQPCYFDWKQHIKLSGKDCEIDINLYHKKGKEATRIWHVHNKMGSIIDYIIWTIYLKKPENRLFNIPFCVTKTMVNYTNRLPNSLNKLFLKILLSTYKKIGYSSVQVAMPNKFFTNLTKLMFYDMEFNVPEETEDYLIYRYGKDWRIPKKDYIRHNDDCSVV